MRWALLLLAMTLDTPAQTVRYELRGHLAPPAQASVWLHGAITPFEDSALADENGNFRFRDLLPGAYTLGVFVPGRGELRRTIEIGPSQADKKGRVELTVELHDSELEPGDSARHSALVSATELSIPDQARREYDEAQKKLAKREVESAAAHLKRAVELAPQFAAAWNNLGTIAYQSREFSQAEQCFRKALAADPNSYMAAVNLGGVLINLTKFDEALDYNRHAVLTHPNDALANSQLGMNYYYLDKLDLSKKYLTLAKQLDPAHFSHPQLMLAQIDLRRQDRAAAVSELQEFLQYHPDSPEATKVKENIAKLRGQPDPAQEFAATSMAHSYEEKSGQVTIGAGRHNRTVLAAAQSSECLGCHAGGNNNHPAAIGCVSCHDGAGSGKPDQAACLRCHPASGGSRSAHGPGASAEDRFELNSAAYRLLQSRCYQASAGKLTCTTCHPPHTFAKTVAGYRTVCRGCHPTMHNGAELECTRCHMPKRPVQDDEHVLVTDHRIQRPL